MALSVREGKISSVLLLRRLRSGSHKNAPYAAFREVRPSDPHHPAAAVPHRPSDAPAVTAATNKVEAVKFNALLTKCLIFHNTLDIAQAVRELQAEGWKVESRRTWPRSRPT